MKYILIFLIFFSCRNHESEQEKSSFLKDTSDTYVNQNLRVNLSNASVDSSNNSLNIILDSIKILSVNDMSLKESNDEELIKECNNWGLSKEQVLEIIRLSKRIDGHTWSYLYDVMPCRISGELIWHSIRYKYRINAGSFIYMKPEDGEGFLMGCSSDSCKSFFLRQGGDIKRDLDTDHE